MKKLRIKLAILAVLLSLGGAIVTSAYSEPPCVYEPQYYKSGFNYYPAGVMGLQYACIISPWACTYYRPDPVLQPTNFVPCRQGVYYQIVYPN